MESEESGRRVQPKKKVATIDENEITRIVQHCAVFGELRTCVREFEISEVKPYAQYPVSVNISFVEPRKRQWAYITITPDNLRYATIERGGDVLYDSREDVFCDMAQWTESNQQHAEWREHQHTLLSKARGIPSDRNGAG